MSNKDQNNLQKKGNNILFLICLVVLICAVAVGGWQAYKKHQANLKYEQLRADMEQAQDQEEDSELFVESEEPAVDIPIDFDTVQSQYPNAYAWIQIPDTPVDYPILQSTEEMDPDYYLEHTIDGEENLPGAIYTQRTWNSNDMTDPVTVIYGHNMRNDSMFGSLGEYRNEDYRQAHPYIYVYTPEHIYKYQVFAAVTYTSEHILGTYDCNDNPVAYQEFLDSLEEKGASPTWVSHKPEVTVEDKIIVLSTCNSNDAQRYLICGVLVEKQ